MKKILCMMLAVVLLMGMAGCSGKKADGDAEKKSEASEQVSEPSKEEISEPENKDVYSFETEGTMLTPGEAFDAKELREASSLYVVPSCAIDGEDNVYNYDSFEVTAFKEGDNEYIYSIYFIDPNIETQEGLALGDTREKMEELYGTDGEEVDGQIVYKKEKTMLIFILDDDIVYSIEYRLDI